MHRHLSKRFGPAHSPIIFSIQRPRVMFMNGVASPCAILKLHVPPESDTSKSNRGNERSTRLVLANLLATPVSNSFVMFVPTTATPQVGADTETAVGHNAKRESQLARASSMSSHGAISSEAKIMRHQSSMPQLAAKWTDSAWSMNSRQNSLSTFEPQVIPHSNSQKSMLPSQGQRQPLRFDFPKSPSMKVEDITRPSLDARDGNVSNLRNCSTLGPAPDGRKRNTLKKRCSYSVGQAYYPNSSHASRSFPRRPRSRRHSISPKWDANEVIQPGKPVVLTTSRTSQADLHHSTDPLFAPGISDNSIADHSHENNETPNVPDSHNPRRSRFITAATSYLRKTRMLQK